MAEPVIITTWETEVGGSDVQVQYGLQREFREVQSYLVRHCLKINYKERAKGVAQW